MRRIKRSDTARTEVVSFSSPLWMRGTYRGTSLERKRPPPKDHHGFLGKVLLQGPREARFLMSEVLRIPPYAPAERHHRVAFEVRALVRQSTSSHTSRAQKSTLLSQPLPSHKPFLFSLCYYSCTLPITHPPMTPL